MYGAVIGDIAGSVYEWKNVKTKEFELFRKRSRCTDDSVMTVAVADALLQAGPDAAVEEIRKAGADVIVAGHSHTPLSDDTKTLCMRRTK